MPKKVYSPSGAADVEKPIETKSSVRETDAKVAGAPVRPVIDATKEEKKTRKLKADCVRHSVIPTGDCW